MNEIMGERIATLRKEKGLSQFELSLELDLGSGFIGNIEVGRTSISLETLILFCDYFETTPDYLLGYRDTK